MNDVESILEKLDVKDGDVLLARGDLWTAMTFEGLWRCLRESGRKNVIIVSLGPKDSLETLEREHVLKLLQELQK